MPSPMPYCYACYCIDTHPVTEWWPVRATLANKWHHSLFLHEIPTSFVLRRQRLERERVLDIRLFLTCQPVLFNHRFTQLQNYNSNDSFFFPVVKMSGTLRNRTMGRGQIPFEGSNIPRKVDHASSLSQGVSSDVGASTVSASRQKQSKRDEVLSSLLRTPFGGVESDLETPRS